MIKLVLIVLTSQIATYCVTSLVELPRRNSSRSIPSDVSDPNILIPVHQTSNTTLPYLHAQVNDRDVKDNTLLNNPEHTIVLVGGSKHGNSISTFALTSRSICPNALIPSLPSGASASFAAYVEDCIVVCGGRESTLELNNECWKYNLTAHHHNYEHDEEVDEGGLWKEWKESYMWKEEQKSWDKISPLPNPLAGSAVASFGGKIWVFGGLVEEDYYDTEILNEYYYYDYVVEVAGKGVIVYDPQKDEWNSVNIDLPQARLGSCALVIKDNIILIGGKGHLEDLTGSDEIWEFNPSRVEWNSNVTWPRMKRQRYYHGCTMGSLDGEIGVFVVGGRGDEFNSGNTAEFLPLKPSKGRPKWIELPTLRMPHPNMPGASYMDGALFVIGGGGPPLSGGEKTIEVFDGIKWSSFVAMNQEKIFSASVSIPNWWLSSCAMEPNLGIHKYHQKKTKELLKGKQWICNGEHLQLSDQEDSLMVGGCTIPGCYYPHFFSHHVNSSVIKAMRVRGGRLLCQHADKGTPANRIECRLKCKKGWKNANNIDVTICTKGQVEALARIKNLTADKFHNHHGSLRKTTNFTTDYLECRRDLLQSRLNFSGNIPEHGSNKSKATFPSTTLIYDDNITTISSDNDSI